MPPRKHYRSSQPLQQRLERFNLSQHQYDIYANHLIDAYQFNHVQAERILARAQSPSQYLALVKHHDVLRPYFNQEQLTDLAAGLNGDVILDTVASHRAQLALLGFSSSQIVTMAAHSGGNISIHAVIGYYAQTKDHHPSLNLDLIVEVTSLPGGGGKFTYLYKNRLRLVDQQEHSLDDVVETVKMMKIGDTINDRLELIIKDPTLKKRKITEATQPGSAKKPESTAIENEVNTTPVKEVFMVSTSTVVSDLTSTTDQEALTPRWGVSLPEDSNNTSYVACLSPTSQNLLCAGLSYFLPLAGEDALCTTDNRPSHRPHLSAIPGVGYDNGLSAIHPMGFYTASYNVAQATYSPMDPIHPTAALPPLVCD